MYQNCSVQDNREIFLSWFEDYGRRLKYCVPNNYTSEHFSLIEGITRFYAYKIYDSLWNKSGEETFLTTAFQNALVEDSVPDVVSSLDADGNKKIYRREISYDKGLSLPQIQFLKHILKFY